MEFIMMNTFFACPNRMSSEMIETLSEELSHDPVAIGILNAVDSFVVIINSNRQIVSANSNFLELLSVTETELRGQRLGESLQCVNASDAPNGCGTSKKCKYCGAVLTMIEAFEKHNVVNGECSLLVKNEKGIAGAEFRVKASPLSFNQQEYVVLVLTDVSSVKRREALEKVFLHDIANTICGLKGWAEVLLECESEEAAERIVTLANQLVDDVNSQRILLNAENNEIELEYVQTSVNKVMTILKTVFTSADITMSKELEVLELAEDVKFKTDMSLFMRVLINMVKNAFEASEQGDTVIVTTSNTSNEVLWSVHNNKFIPENIAAHIFQRSYSTKSSKGRGLGTYSMKLFGENYLKGKVWFDSSPGKGTNFYFSINT